jgi:hypothetical protein
MPVVSGHDLSATDAPVPGQAERAFAAGQHRGDDDGTPQQRRIDPIAHLPDDPADFMPQRQRQRSAGLHAEVKEREVRVTDTAARDLHLRLAHRGSFGTECTSLEGRSRSGHHPRLPPLLGHVVRPPVQLTPAPRRPGGRQTESSRTRGIGPASESEPAKQLRRSSGDSRITVRRKRQSQRSLGSYTASRYSPALPARYRRAP